jgi:hypothetical protein
VLDFNAAAIKQGNGKRDILLQEVLLSFLVKAQPDSKSAQLRKSEVTSRRATKLIGAETAQIMDRIKEREAIRVSRECAEKILEVTAEAGRKGPKRSPDPVANRKRKAS